MVLTLRLDEVAIEQNQVEILEGEAHLWVEEGQKPQEVGRESIGYRVRS